MIYIISHYYATNHKDFCIILQSNKTEEEIIEICNAAAFFLEDYYEPSVSLDIDCLKELLTNFYEALDIKESVIPYIKGKFPMPDGVSMNYYFQVGKEHKQAVAIDLYGAREMYCGPNYRKVIDKWIYPHRDAADIQELIIRKGKEE